MRLNPGQKNANLSKKFSEDMRGFIAIDEDGNIGIITFQTKQMVLGFKGYRGLAYTGIDICTGMDWCSPKPNIVGKFSGFLSSSLTFNEWVQRNGGKKSVRKT